MIKTFKGMKSSAVQNESEPLPMHLGQFVQVESMLHMRTWAADPVVTGERKPTNEDGRG